jgi:hypothetical protein
VLTIDPSTGKCANIATVPSLDVCGGVFGDNNAGLAFTHGAFFFLNCPKLYRVQP